ncbi:HAD family hydrolase [Singulisphaera acidiphila]|uniref:Haloacid dehalogenase superfamily protein, subfamily IA, variant 3 with third motif having DD or ED n=1 Tax=Singulisphaera acidiphila (strain ATCC BAA-1392 / DSM 18658 / VKM B-2454 / MOB10) TaxID=886293 RepID=L0DKX9_SINAD|nr:HAD family phosphatase [Singulisphaera acidiphila]AGA29887.1 haloacid dehalogenase superfamily protein, subfamily IA, variant 3 with third motif having DD or ED [Singulisphaera acidiphila DSM 18658]
MPTRAVLFDFDGVIADTENIHIAAWQRTLARLGWEVPDEVCARAVEVDDRIFLADLFAQRKLEQGDVEGWVRSKQELTASMLTASPRIYPGLVELVRSLIGKVQLAIVSTTWRENIEIVLKAANLEDAFPTVVGKQDVTLVKPDPEGYRLALQKLGIAPEDAIALEDSATGLAAARAAGLPVIAVGHRLPRGEWVGSSNFVDDLTNQPKLMPLLGLGNG